MITYEWQCVQRSLIFWASLNSHSLEKNECAHSFTPIFKNWVRSWSSLFYKECTLFSIIFIPKFPIILWVLNVGIECLVLLQVPKTFATVQIFGARPNVWLHLVPLQLLLCWHKNWDQLKIVCDFATCRRTRHKWTPSLSQKYLAVSIFGAKIYIWLAVVWSASTHSTEYSLASFSILTLILARTRVASTKRVTSGASFKLSKKWVL